MATKARLALRDHAKAEAALAGIPHEFTGAFLVEVDAGALPALQAEIDAGSLVVISTPQGDEAKAASAKGA